MSFGTVSDLPGPLPGPTSRPERLWRGAGTAAATPAFSLFRQDPVVVVGIPRLSMFPSACHHTEIAMCSHGLGISASCCPPGSGLEQLAAQPAEQEVPVLI